MNKFNQWPDVAKIRAQARVTWETGQRQRIPLQERIGLSVPWWLIIVAAVFFALSVPHTAQTFEIITPAVGYIAPLGVEFGLLYTSFRRRQLRALTGSRAPWTVLLLEILLFVVAIIVNGVGTLQAVADDAGLRQQSVTDVIHSFGGMSATRQVALVLVPLAALIIPVGTMVAGEGLAALFLENRERRDTFDDRWRDVAQEVEFYALRDAAINAGAPPTEAVQWSAQITRYRGVRVSVFTQQRTDGQANRRSKKGRQMDKRTQARTYLEEHPEASALSVRDFASRSGVGRTTAANILNEYRTVEFSGNGHGEEER